MNRISLNGNDWKMKEFVGMDWVWRDSVMPETGDVRWWYDAAVPGSVLNDLIQNEKVPDPFYEMNSKLVEWVPARTWVYRKEFELPSKTQEADWTLCFEGIDYSSEIFLNGTSLGKQEGMYVPWKAEVTELLNYGGTNLLAVVIEPAPFEQPQVGKTSLVATHKSRMTYWWDFCPRMIHQGIWQPVWLESTTGAAFADVHITSQLSAGGTQAVVLLETEISISKDREYRLEGTFGEIAFAGKAEGGKNTFRLTLDRPRLWWPNGEGEAYEYPVRIVLTDPESGISDERELLFGIREIYFDCNDGIQEEAGAFLLTVNGRRIYMNGYNWVPANVLYGMPDEEKVNHLIRLAREAGINIFRVWGGGLIEKDSFYQKCASAGILVWQEFILSSSGIDNKTPDNAGYREMLLAQASIIIKAKRNHTALAVWCGGNELQDDDGNPLDNQDPVLRMLKQTVEELDPGRKWLPTSPSGGRFLNSFENLDKYPEQLYDVHGPWEHQGLQKHCELYNRGTSLLSTEFGVEGMTNASTLYRSVAREHLLPANKENEIYFHRGAWWTNEPLVRETFGGDLDDIESIRKASQYMQYEGLKYAVECNRRRAFRNSGSFPWQFNEPFPNLYCTSAVDFYGIPKPVYYGMKKAYGRYRITAAFESASLAGKDSLNAELFAASDEVQPFGEEPFTIAAMLFDGRGKEICKKNFLWDGADSKKPVGSISEKPEQLKGGLILLRLVLQRAGQVLAENEYLFTGTGNLGHVFETPCGMPGVTAADGSIQVRNTNEAPLWFVYLTGEQEGNIDFYPEQNYFCLMPGEEKTVPAGRQTIPSSITIQALNLAEGSCTCR